MKVITEERLMYLIENDGDGSKVYCTVSTADLEELDTLTVTKLRPMSEAPSSKHTEILAMYSGYMSFIALTRRSTDTWETGFDDGRIYDRCELIGWLPMPTYNPEKK